MKTVLKCPLQVHRVALFAEMAWLELRPELGLLCREALDSRQGITIGTVQSVLPGIAEAGAGNIVRWCEMLGLCDSSGALTKIGEDAAQTNEVPMPEQGVYRLTMVQHELLGSRVLHAERLKSTRDPSWNELSPVTVVPDFGRTFVSAINPKERFSVRGLPSNHGDPRCFDQRAQSKCSLSWALDFDQNIDRWRLEGELLVDAARGKQCTKPIVHEPESGGVDLPRVAAEWGEGPLAKFGVWRERERQLEVSFGGLTESQLNTFRKTFQLDVVEIPGRGTYDDVTLEDVPIAPRTARDAQSWAMARLESRFSSQPGYRSRSDVRREFVELIEDTSLSRHSPVLLAHVELLRKFESDRSAVQYWSLAAPVDLAPDPPTAVELDRVSIGAPHHAPSADPSREVELRPGEKLSMREVVRRLVGGMAPAHVLICDPHVVGDDNLEALKMLVDALRVAGPELIIDVWTRGDQDELKRIQSIAKSQPRDFRAVFGGRGPHDRYFLARGRNGEGVAWRMTHSLLHGRLQGAARNPDAPLKWNDLLATKREPEQLESALRDWLIGDAR